MAESMKMQIIAVAVSLKIFTIMYDSFEKTEQNQGTSTPENACIYKQTHACTYKTFKW